MTFVAISDSKQRQNEELITAIGACLRRHGMRLGRGGGSYDRALGRVPVGTFTCTLLHAAEVVDEVPAGDHDRRVTAAATPDGIIWFQG